MSQLALHLLGPPRVERDGVTLKFRYRKNLALLAYLAVAGLGDPQMKMAEGFSLKQIAQFAPAVFGAEILHRRHRPGRRALRRIECRYQTTLGETSLVLAGARL
jgi:hypothetical protein